VPPALIDLIPPSSIGIGPVQVGFYGLGYVIAVAVLLLVTAAQARRAGIDPGVVTGSLLIVGACALVGARTYHVIDQWAYYAADPARIVLPPYSGLGLYGGIAGAIVGIAFVARRHGIPVWRALDLVVPGTFFAQAIARWGNWFNQELYGPPTHLPWGIAIDCAHRVAPYPCDQFPAATTGFHPLFLYESILDLAGGLIALVLARRAAGRLRDGDLASFWMIWYGSTRLILETYRSGWNWTLAGVPVASLVAAALIVVGTLTVVRRHRADRAPRQPSGTPEGPPP
jgi:phosphatidylglycerol:prolipoprotein diacylglycerol transferase